MANAAVHSSGKHHRIYVLQCSGSASEQGEVLCLQDVSRHVLGFPRGLSWGRGGEALQMAAEEPPTHTPAPGQGAARSFLLAWGDGGSSADGLLWLGSDSAGATFATREEAGRAFCGSHRVLDYSRGVFPPCPGCGGLHGQPWCLP